MKGFEAASALFGALWVDIPALVWTLLGALALLVLGLWASRRRSLPPSGEEVSTNRDVAAAVDRDLATAARALSTSKQRPLIGWSRRVVREDLRLAKTLRDAQPGTHHDKSVRAVRRTLAETLGMATYLERRLAGLEPGLGVGLSGKLAAAKLSLQTACDDLASGQVARALGRVQAVRVALIACRRVLVRRSEAAAWLDLVPALVKRLDGDLLRLQRLGFRGLVRQSHHDLVARAAIARARLVRGERDAFALVAKLQADIEQERRALSTSEVNYEEIQVNLARLRAAIARLESARPEPGLSRDVGAERFAARVKTLGLELAAAAQANNKDAQHFKLSRRRLVALAAEVRMLELAQGLPQTREVYGAGAHPGKRPGRVTES
jgi:hypothetical protein